ncbi:MAG: hypothetical protein ACI4SC_03825 [Candidatus Neoclostridium sp.]
MFCKYCGKPVSDGDVCPECAAKMEEKMAGEKTEAVKAEPACACCATYDKKYGLGSGLTAVITGFFGVITAVVAFCFAVFSTVGLFPDDAFQGMTAQDIEVLRDLSVAFNAVSIVTAIVSVALAVVAIVFGIKAIKAFKQAKENGVKPIATLILGICGVTAGGVIALMLLLTVIWWFIGAMAGIAQA